MGSRTRLAPIGLAVALVGVGLSVVPTSSSVALAAAPESDATSQVASTLGAGLGRLSSQARSGATTSTGLRVDQGALAIRDRAGRVLVSLTPRAGADRAALRRQATARGLRVTAVDESTGTLEGFVPLGRVGAIAGLAGTGTLAQVPRPHVNVGATTSQAVPLQRIRQVLRAGVTGEGITVGVLSDSYDTATTDVFGEPLAIHAEDDVASGDLPGAGNPEHPDPVVVLEDSPDGTDEGRAMLQIVHDVAPDAKLCFATAFNGEVGFADNIRALADPAGGCGADVIVDDVSYLTEPMFSDGVIARAVDDVAADGVSYFSSAGNAGDQQSWSSRETLVPGRAGARRAGLDFGDVDPALYSGGLQDMDPGAGSDVAQTLALGRPGGTIDLQWDDPLDANGADLGDPYFDETGEITAVTPEPTFTFTPTAGQVGQRVLIVADGIPSGSTDLVLTVETPDGTTIGPVDTGTSPENTTAVLQAGDYDITVSGFKGDTGDFTLQVLPIVGPSRTSTDYNALFFTPDGEYLGAFGEDNTLTGRPFELLSVGGFPRLQLVIAKTTRRPTPVSRLRYTIFDNINVAEYWNPRSAATFGHSAAVGASSVAAYDPFGPYLPEAYTSQGGELVYPFGPKGRRLARPEVRRKPDLASTDRGNTTFFVADDSRDPDDFPNFGGTSAAAPHAAGIAALLLDKSGGPGSLSPTRVRQRLQRTAFAHDLDPFVARGRSGGVRIVARGSQSDETNLVPGSLRDRRFFSVRNTGKVPLRSLTFFGATGSPTATRPGGPRSGGMVFDRRPLGTRNAYRDGGFPFAIGVVDGGLRRGTVSARLTQSIGKPGRFRNLTVTFGKGLDRGQLLKFGIDRDLRRFSPLYPTSQGNGADELGGAVALPSGRTIAKGLRFRAVRRDGSVVKGVMVNKLGKGWTLVDGYGMVDAEAAVLGR